MADNFYSALGLSIANNDGSDYSKAASSSLEAAIKGQQFAYSSAVDASNSFSKLLGEPSKIDKDGNKIGATGWLGLAEQQEQRAQDELGKAEVNVRNSIEQQDRLKREEENTNLIKGLNNDFSKNLTGYSTDDFNTGLKNHISSQINTLKGSSKLKSLTNDEIFEALKDDASMLVIANRHGLSGSDIQQLYNLKKQNQELFNIKSIIDKNTELNEKGIVSKDALREFANTKYNTYSQAGLQTGTIEDIYKLFDRTQDSYLGRKENETDFEFNERLGLNNQDRENIATKIRKILNPNEFKETSANGNGNSNGSSTKVNSSGNNINFKQPEVQAAINETPEVKKENLDIASKITKNGEVIPFYNVDGTETENYSQAQEMINSNRNKINEMSDNLTISSDDLLYSFEGAALDAANFISKYAPSLLGLSVGGTAVIGAGKLGWKGITKGYTSINKHGLKGSLKKRLEEVKELGKKGVEIGNKALEKGKTVDSKYKLLSKAGIVGKLGVGALIGGVFVKDIYDQYKTNNTSDDEIIDKINEVAQNEIDKAETLADAERISFEALRAANTSTGKEIIVSFYGIMNKYKDGKNPELKNQELTRLALTTDLNVLKEYMKEATNDSYLNLNGEKGRKLVTDVYNYVSEVQNNYTLENELQRQQQLVNKDSGYYAGYARDNAIKKVENKILQSNPSNLREGTEGFNQIKENNREQTKNIQGQAAQDYSPINIMFDKGESRKDKLSAQAQANLPLLTKDKTYNGQDLYDKTTNDKEKTFLVAPSRGHIPMMTYINKIADTSEPNQLKAWQDLINDPKMQKIISEWETSELNNPQGILDRVWNGSTKAKRQEEFFDEFKDLIKTHFYDKNIIPRTIKSGKKQPIKDVNAMKEIFNPDIIGDIVGMTKDISQKGDLTFKEARNLLSQMNQRFKFGSK